MNICLALPVRLARRCLKHNSFPPLSSIFGRCTFTTSDAEKRFCSAKDISEEEKSVVQPDEVPENDEDVMKILNVAEKNDAAKNIAKLMCGTQNPPSRRGDDSYGPGTGDNKTDAIH